MERKNHDRANRTAQSMTKAPVVAFAAILLLAGCQGPEQGPKLELEATAAAASIPATAPPGEPAAVPEEPRATPTVAHLGNLAGGESGSAPFTGTLEAHRRATIAPRIGATVMTVHVREGERVRAGAPLVSLDTSDIQLQVRQATAMLDAARAQLDQARLDFDRTAKLARTEQVAASQLDLAATRSKAAQASLDQAQVALDMANKALRDSVVRAPFSGVVVKRFVSEGERVVTMPPSALVTLEETSTVDLRIQVPELQFRQVGVGAGLTAHIAALGTDVPAVVTRVIPSIDPRTRSFAAIAELPNEQRLLRPGMFAAVRLTAPAAPAPVVPATTATAAPAPPATPPTAPAPPAPGQP